MIKSVLANYCIPSASSQKHFIPNSGNYKTPIAVFEVKYGNKTVTLQAPILQSKYQMVFEKNVFKNNFAACKGPAREISWEEYLNLLHRAKTLSKGRKTTSTQAKKIFERKTTPAAPPKTKTPPVWQATSSSEGTYSTTKPKFYMPLPINGTVNLPLAVFKAQVEENYRKTLPIVKILEPLDSQRATFSKSYFEQYFIECTGPARPLTYSEYTRELRQLNPHIVVPSPATIPLKDTDGDVETKAVLPAKQETRIVRSASCLRTGGEVPQSEIPKIMQRLKDVRDKLSYDAFTDLFLKCKCNLPKTFKPNIKSILLQNGLINSDESIPDHVRHVTLSAIREKKNKDRPGVMDILIDSPFAKPTPLPRLKRL